MDTENKSDYSVFELSLASDKMLVFKNEIQQTFYELDAQKAVLQEKIWSLIKAIFFDSFATHWLNLRDFLILFGLLLAWLDNRRTSISRKYRLYMDPLSELFWKEITYFIEYLFWIESINYLQSMEMLSIKNISV